jgi:predicted ATPase
MAFVGRERELGRLAAGLERAAGGGPVRIALTGPAGVGISRLLDEIEVRLRDVAEVTVLRGAAFAPLSGMPYAPLADALRSVLIALPDGPLQRVVGLAGQDLGTLLPELRGRLGALAEPTMLVSPDQRAARMAEGLIGLIDRLAGSGAVLLAIEDLHWADPGTLRLVSTLLRVSRRVPLCLVLTYRPDELHRRHAMRALADAIEADRDVEHIELPALERREVAALLEAVIAERPTGGLVAAAMEASLGNPLLVEQLAAARAVERAVRLSEPFE